MRGPDHECQLHVLPMSDLLRYSPHLGLLFEYACLGKPNARCQPPLEAGATQERAL